MTAALLLLAFVLVLTQRLPTVVGTVVALVASYWLPTRPNREPPDPNHDQ